MNIVVINGSPRKDGNTAKMCQAFVDGAKSTTDEISVEIVNLYDVDFKGCRSCFACKLKDAKTYGKCVVKDPITQVLSKAASADILVLGSPIYLMDISAQMKAFLERLIFPYATYEVGYKSIAPKKMLVATIYTMNVPKEMCPNAVIASTEYFIGHVFTEPRRICAYNTYQFKNYDNYCVEVFDVALKKEYRDTVFPTELKAAFDAGKEMAASLL